MRGYHGWIRKNDKPIGTYMGSIRMVLENSEFFGWTGKFWKGGTHLA
jgi:hypothetical protein